MDAPIALALHGGAGARRHRDYAREIVHMRGLVEAARDRLTAGAAALDVVVETIQALEISGLYVAGRGASPNTAGRYELDAGLMDGATGEAGAVAALEGVESPILVARDGDARHAPRDAGGAREPASSARAQGLARDRRSGRPGSPGRAWTSRTTRRAAPLAHGTVGCVVRDAEGRLAGGTSTGGVFGKLAGRVGDTPIPGAGVWADRTGGGVLHRAGRVLHPHRRGGAGGPAGCGWAGERSAGGDARGAGRRSRRWAGRAA